MKVATGDTQAGVPVGQLYPSLAAHYPNLTLSPYEPSSVAGLDLVFLGLPHGASQRIVPELMGSVSWVVDLSADFRLSDPAAYPQWYGAEHAAPELLGKVPYGLPELFRSDLVGAEVVASAGCYPTSAALALAPLVEAGLVETEGIVVDAASGVSGAGRAPKPNTTFCSADEDFAAYGLLDHRHTPEIEQTLGRIGETGSILFTPHLAPMSRGILATCYARPTRTSSTGELLEVYRERYAREPFVVVTDGSPSTKATLGANTAQVTVRYDERTGWVLALCAIDNLTKGASGQAIQCANIMAGLPESTGLPTVAVYP